MFIARWQFTCRFGKTDDCIAILRHWERDVGQRMGWKASSIRIVTGFIGASESEVEFESRFDNLTDLEGAFGDMQRNRHHGEYMKQLEAIVVPGSNTWKLYRDIEVMPTSL